MCFDSLPFRRRAPVNVKLLILLSSSLHLKNSALEFVWNFMEFQGDIHFDPLRSTPGIGSFRPYLAVSIPGRWLETWTTLQTA